VREKKKLFGLHQEDKTLNINVKPVLTPDQERAQLMERLRLLDEANAAGDADTWWMYPAQPPILAQFLPGYNNLRKGDVNLDDVVNNVDLAIFAEHWLEEFD
jgi:hypothetical protein